MCETVILRLRELRDILGDNDQIQDLTLWITTVTVSKDSGEDELENERNTQFGKPTVRHLHLVISDFTSNLH